MVGNNTVAAAIAEVASAVDTEVEKVRLVATAEMTPRKYFVVATVAVDSAKMVLVVVASLSPLQRYTMHFQFDVYI